MVRLAGLIHLAHQVQGKPSSLWPFPVTGRAMEIAIRLGRALIPHARCVFDQMDMLPELHVARYVLERIQTYEGEKPLARKHVDTSDRSLDACADGNPRSAR